MKRDKSLKNVIHVLSRINIRVNFKVFKNEETKKVNHVEPMD